MSNPGLGLLSYWQIGREATYGITAAATRKFDALDISPATEVGIVRDNSLSGLLARGALYQAANRYRISIKQRLDYTNQLLSWDALFGTGAFGAVGGVTTGANPYAHAFIPLRLLNSHTLEIVQGDIPAGQCARLNGAKITGATIRWAAGGDEAIPSVTWDWIAQTYQTGQAPTGALSLAAANPVLGQEATTVDDGSFPTDTSANVRIKSFEISIQNKLADDRNYLSTLLPDEPVRNDFIEVKWSFVREFQAKTFNDKMLAFSTTSPQLVIGTGVSKRITLQSGSVKVTEVGEPISGPGVIMQNIGLEAFYDPTDLGALKMILEDTAATIT